MSEGLVAERRAHYRFNERVDLPDGASVVGRNPKAV